MSYIVPMKKPICINCPFRSLDNCTLIYLMSDNDGEVTVYVNTMTTSPYCPLVEIPTLHGRLGDLDELKSKFRHCKGNSDTDSAWISTIRRFITQTETIIEAEGSETE